MPSDFSSIPVLDYSLSQNPDTREAFVDSLRHVLVNVGFLYLKNTPVAKSDIDGVIESAPKLFDLSQDKKDRLNMLNSQHFLGYTKLGAEFTKGQTDQREQYDFATNHENQWKPGDPEYLKLWGPAQWPEESDLPGYKELMLRYLRQVEDLSYQFIGLMAEAFGLKKEEMKVFFDTPSSMQHRAKVVKYPSLDTVSTNQGVGPHVDGGFLTFLLQASHHPGLQVQNLAGDWIDAPPIDGTFVVNIGKALENVTQGLARATTHRVLSPERGSSPRYSIPFFQNITQGIRLSDIHLHFPENILELKASRGQLGAVDSVNYTEYGQEVTGHVSLIGRIKSHPDVAQRHYPGLFSQIFPQGLPAQGSAY